MPNVPYLVLEVKDQNVDLQSLNGQNGTIIVGDVTVNVKIRGVGSWNVDEATFPKNLTGDVAITNISPG